MAVLKIQLLSQNVEGRESFCVIDRDRTSIRDVWVPVHGELFNDVEWFLSANCVGLRVKSLREIRREKNQVFYEVVVQSSPVIEVC